MLQLAPIELEDGTIIYVEATKNVNTPEILHEEKESLVAKNGIEKVVQKFKTIEGTIRAYTTYTLNAFRELAVANVDHVTLEFGITIGGEAGVPYVTKGTIESNLKVTVQ